MSTIEEAREQAREALANHAVNIMETDYWCDVVLASALRALLDAAEPPAQTEPAEDEREALVMTLYANGMAGNLHEPLRRQAVQKWADAILAAGYSKGPRPITDEMVAAADFAIMPYWGERYPSGSLTTEIARAALEAAEGARR